MRLAITALILAAGSGIALAQKTPQLTWEGYVREGADLFIHGRSVDPQGRTTGDVDRPTVRFTSPLPAVTQRVKMEVRRGRGRVEIAEQPNPENEFTLIVRIHGQGTEPEFYSLRFFWNADAARGDTSPRTRRNPARETTGK